MVDIEIYRSIIKFNMIVHKGVIVFYQFIPLCFFIQIIKVCHNNPDR